MEQKKWQITYSAITIPYELILVRLERSMLSALLWWYCEGKGAVESK